MLFLVRHGRPLIDRSRPAHEWELDPAGYDDSEWIEDFDDAVRRAFAVPTAAAVPGWEPLAALTATDPDLDRWRALQMPDLVIVERLRST